MDVLKLKEFLSILEVEMKCDTFNKVSFLSETKKSMNLLDNCYDCIWKVIENDSFCDKDMNRLNYMVSMAIQVKNKEIKEHDASVKVGQVLVDDIVKPQLNS